MAGRPVPKFTPATFPQIAAGTVAALTPDCGTSSADPAESATSHPAHSGQTLTPQCQNRPSSGAGLNTFLMVCYPAKIG